MSRHDLTGTRRLWRLAVRRDRFRIVVWVVMLGALVLLSAMSIADLYTTPEDLARYARLSRGNDALIVQSGPGYGLDDPTTGAVLMNETAIWSIIVVALLGIMTITRHTRAEEAADRAQLLRSLPVGRHAATLAALAQVVTMVALAAVVVTLGIVSQGFPAAGALAFALSLVGAAAVFAGIALVSAQVAATPRAATGWALVVLAVSFVVRAVGDVAAPWLSWLSPIGWAQAVRAFADERWWVLALPAAATVLLAWTATTLADRRDLGSGMLPQRPGAAEASHWLATPVALAGRLHRGALAGWVVGVAVLGFFYGILTREVEKIILDDPELADFFASMGGGSIVDMYLATTAMLLGLLAGGYVVSAVLRLHTEERDGRAGLLLAGPLSRTSWSGSHLVVSLGGMLVVLAVGGAAAGSGAAISLGEPGRIPEMVLATVATGAGGAVLAGLAYLLAAAQPRFALGAWVGVAVAATVGLLAGVLDLPMWVRDLSPYQHVPALPAADATVLPFVMLLGAAAVLIEVGRRGLQHRDLGGP